MPNFDSSKTSVQTNIDNNTDTLVNPATWAFSIWGPIYALTTLFWGYQALPDSWVPDRNDNLLYQNGIGWTFVANMAFSLLWSATFQSGQTWGYVLSEFFIVGMLATATMMMDEANSHEVNSTEFFSLRG